MSELGKAAFQAVAELAAAKAIPPDEHDSLSISSASSSAYDSLATSCDSYSPTTATSTPSPDGTSAEPASPGKLTAAIEAAQRLTDPAGALPQKGEVLEDDANTPDKWVVRDPRMVRLTGKHPFNSEAKIADLFAEGFYTPPSLFYVRNHGAVPNIDRHVRQQDDWKLTFKGLRPAEGSNSTDDGATEVFTIRSLQEKFKVYTRPMTFVCAGNRRKEQNTVNKGLGFSWGAGGVSTALITGVLLADVLAYLVQEGRIDLKQAKHVVFEGADQLPKGPYGTSQRWSWAADHRKGMMLAWAMNGEPLTPDHGYPLRTVIPGQIGGRHVKWLHSIEISPIESQHHLHFFDNKVLPTQVDPDQARSENSWWYDPQYIIWDLSVNSAIATPNHDEVVTLPDDLSSAEATYTVRGYAYSGGGRKITRAEVSLDDGQSWTLSKINYPEDEYYANVGEDEADDHSCMMAARTDQYWCWAFWELEVPLRKLWDARIGGEGSGYLCVRAADEGLAKQPRDMYWNATGMMNNWWFRVAIHQEGPSSLKFEHPTMAGTQSGGWMARLKDEGQDILRPVFNAKASSTAVAVPEPKKKEVERLVKPGVNRKITLAELKANSTTEKPWFVVNGEVYDGTEYLAEHPGGPESITGVHGTDASEDFMAIHSSDAKKKLIEYHIGTLDTSGGGSLEEVDEGLDDIKKPFLGKTWRSITLLSTTVVSHDSRLFRFRLDRPERALGLPVGQHVFVRLRYKIAGGYEQEYVQRAYTPVSQPSEKGEILFLIKLYLPSTEMPKGGLMSIGFNQLVPGDTIDLKGPLGSFVWLGDRTARWKSVERKGIQNIGLICGGSGITPILAIARQLLRDFEAGQEVPKVWLLDGNRLEEDILCRDELDVIAAKLGTERFVLRHTLTQPPEGWTLGRGRINEQSLREWMPPCPEKQGADCESLVMICGPPGMIDGAKVGLANIGWDVPNSLVVF